MRLHSGMGKGEILAFIVVLGVGAMIFLYMNQKPKVIERTVVIQQAPPPPVQEAPPPPPVVVQTPTPPPPAPKPVVVAPPPPPPTPECVIIEQKLRAAQADAVAIQTQIGAAKQAALNDFHNSDDYKNAAADLDAKQKAHDAAVAQIASDNATNSDSSQDAVTLQTAATDLLNAKAKLQALQADAFAGNTAVADKQQALSDANDRVADLQNQLSDYIANAITQDVQANCSIESVKADPKTEIIEAKMLPSALNDSRASADAAFNQIGYVLANTLQHSPFTWSIAKFTVFVDYHDKKVPEFQATYLRDAIDRNTLKKPDGSHFDNQQLVSLAELIWLNRSVNDLQGIPAPSPMRQFAMDANATPKIQYTYSLAVGGCRRSDGSFSPPTIVSQTYTEDMPVTAAVQNRVAPLRMPLYSNTNPITNTPP